MEKPYLIIQLWKTENKFFYKDCCSFFFQNLRHCRLHVLNQNMKHHPREVSSQAILFSSPLELRCSRTVMVWNVNVTIAGPVPYFKEGVQKQEKAKIKLRINKTKLDLVEQPPRPVPLGKPWNCWAHPSPPSLQRAAMSTHTSSRLAVHSWWGYTAPLLPWVN